MIQANELRLGNWVRRLNETNFLKVEMIDSSGNIKFFGLDEHLFDLEDSQIEPVTLSPVILKKIGFVTADYEIDVIAWDYKDKFLLSQDGVPPEDKPIIFEWDNGSNDVTTTVSYLHQLQNLYFALTGEELKIDLL